MLLDRTKWSNNSALMIRAGKLLYEATREHGYLEDALQTEASAVRRWMPDDGETGIACEGRFAHLLLEAIMEAPARKPYVDSAARGWVYVATRLRDTRGRYPKRWDGSRSGDLARWEWIDQASVARALWVVVRERGE